MAGAASSSVAATFYAPARPAHVRHNLWAIALTVTMATFMELLDTSISNVSLPHIAGARHQLRRGHLGADQLSGRERRNPAA
jgi:MFS transporter, DHA2 family, multidrug resistance protein